MLNLWFETMLLAIEAQGVVNLRLAKLAQGGAEGWVEAERMISEKVDAGCEATRTLMGGGHAGTVVGRYREHVQANALRLRRD